MKFPILYMESLANNTVYLVRCSYFLGVVSPPLLWDSSYSKTLVATYAMPNAQCPIDQSLFFDVDNIFSFDLREQASWWVRPRANSPGVFRRTNYVPQGPKCSRDNSTWFRSSKRVSQLKRWSCNSSGAKPLSVLTYLDSFVLKRHATTNHQPPARRTRGTVWARSLDRSGWWCAQ